MEDMPVRSDRGDDKQGAHLTISEKGASWFQGIVENLPDYVMRYDDQCRHLYVNPAVYRLTGMPEGSYIGKAHHELGFPKDQCTFWQDSIQTVFRTGKPVRRQFSYTFGGERMELDWSLTPECSEDGEVVTVLGVARDITAIQQATDILRDRQARLELALEAARAGSWERDIRTGVITWDTRTHRIFGIEPGTFPGTREAWLELVHEEDRERALLRIEAWMVTGDQYHDQYRVPQSSGEVRVIASYGKILRDDEGQPLRAVGMVLDATRQERHVRERGKLDARLQHAQKLESLGVLAGGIAHDFNNVLMSILGHADLALFDLPQHALARNSITEIVSGARRAAELCSQLLAYSGRGRFELAPVCLSELVREMLDMLRVSISKTAIIRVELAENLPPIMADATQIRQVVMNLITNASDAISDRSGVITLRTSLLSCDTDYLESTYTQESLLSGEYVLLEVSDTGCGMDETVRQRIFDPFFTTKANGRGLGMAAVLGIVRGHGGGIKCYSEYGKGTSFKVLLPVCTGSVNPAQPSSNDAEWQGFGEVMLVDDDEPVRKVAARMITRMGFTVLECADGREALDVFEKDTARFRCILLDMTMPHMDGEQTFRELRKLNDNIPIVIISGYHEQEVAPRFAGRDAAAFLQKPFQIKALASRIRSVLGEA